MITWTHYKQRPAVRIAQGSVDATFLPEDGGKLTSLRLNGAEVLAQAPGAAYLRLDLQGSYVAAECSAFDDMFPTIDPCEIGGRRYLDHGEVCRRSFDCRAEGDTVLLRCEATCVGATLEKRVTIEDEALVLRYTLTNRNDRPLPCLWAGHIMLAGEEGAAVESPYEGADSRSIAFGAPLSWETAAVLPARGAVGEYKFYYDDARLPMHCVVRYPHSHRRVVLAFEGDAVRYLGLWFNPGVLNGMYNLAIEPCTAPYDTPLRADAAGKGFCLPPRGSVDFTLRIHACRPVGSACPSEDDMGKGERRTACTVSGKLKFNLRRSEIFLAA